MKNKELVLGIAMLLTIAFTASAQQYDSPSDFRVSPLDGGRSAEITEYVGNKQTVNIPPRIEGMTITKIGSEAFSVKQLIRVTIPNTVTVIGFEAFSYNPLISITIPASVTTIEDGAFRGCTSLASITIPASVTSIDNPFEETAWLENQPDGLVYVNKILLTYKGTMPVNTVINNIRADTIAIGSGAFSRTSLTSITIPSSVTSIGGGAFAWCDNLTSITIPASVMSIGGYAFISSGLTSITIPASVTSIGESAFSGWTSSQTIYIKGHTNQEAADAAWPGQYSWNWRSGCDAQIVYGQ